MNVLLTWNLYHRSERHYHKLSYQFRNINSIVNELNDRRKTIQREIADLSKGNGECAECQGACCRGDYDHFTVIDYLIRTFSDKPLNGYGDLWKPRPLQSLLADLIRSKKSARGGNSNQTATCPHLDASGCNLKIEDRPIRCILWTCKDFRNALPRTSMIKVGLLMKELDSLSRLVVRVYAGVGGS